MQVQPQSFLTAAIYGGRLSASRMAFLRQEKNPDTRGIDGRKGSDFLEKIKKTLACARIRA